MGVGDGVRWWWQVCTRKLAETRAGNENAFEGPANVLIKWKCAEEMVGTVAKRRVAHTLSKVAFLRLPWLVARWEGGPCVTRPS